MSEGEGERKRSYPPECAESVTGHGLSDVRGKCPWCGRKVDRGAPMPRLDGWRTELDRAYRQFYDPDFGDDPMDI